MHLSIISIMVGILGKAAAGRSAASPAVRRIGAISGRTLNGIRDGLGSGPVPLILLVVCYAMDVI